MSDELLPLPEPCDLMRVTWRGDSEWMRPIGDYYTTDQMRAHEAAAIATERQRHAEEVERLRADAERAVADERERWVSAALAGHLYEGSCPDETMPNARDDQCPLCRLLMDAAIDAAKAAT